MIIVVSAAVTAHGKMPPLKTASKTPAPANRVITSRDILISEGIFLKDYQGREQRAWLKVDPPMMTSQNGELAAGVKSRAKYLIDGIYVQFDKNGQPKGLIICEITFVEKGLKNIKEQINTSPLSSQLAMVGQYYDEAANSFRAGEFIRSTSLPSKRSSVNAVPGYHNRNVAIWFDIQKKRWALYSPKGTGGHEIARQIEKLSVYLKKAAARTIPYLYEIYKVTFWDEHLIDIVDVDTHHIRPPGHLSNNLSEDISKSDQAGIRKNMLGDFWANVFKRGNNARFRSKVVEKDPISAIGRQGPKRARRPKGSIKDGLREARPPLGALFIRGSHRGMVLSRGYGMAKRGVEKIEGHRSRSGLMNAPEASRDDTVHKSFKPHFDQQAFYATHQPNSLDIQAPLLDNVGYKPGSIKFSDIKNNRYRVYHNERLKGPNGPAMDLRAGMIIGMGVGIEATALGMSILPAGGAAYVSTLSGLVGGAAVLTGGVIIAALAAGASIQYLFHLKDLKNERKRIEHLLERVHQRFIQENK